MPSLTIKGIPDNLLESLRHKAQAHRRSLNSEVLFLLERSVSARPLDVEAYLSRLDNLQLRCQLPPLTEQLLETAIRDGRP